MIDSKSLGGAWESGPSVLPEPPKGPSLQAGGGVPAALTPENAPLHSGDTPSCPYPICTVPGASALMDGIFRKMQHSPRAPPPHAAWSPASGEGAALPSGCWQSLVGSLLLDPSGPAHPHPRCLSLDLCTKKGEAACLCCILTFVLLKNRSVNTECSFNLVSIALLSAFVKFCILILFVVVSIFFLNFLGGYKAIRVRED